ncbi:hypothetical protein [Caldimonas sp.]|uniref:hypothetical protein n=1 Tax=Caldimonas sp. TaxID=2838790 RepID=UPI00391889B0
MPLLTHPVSRFGLLRAPVWLGLSLLLSGCAVVTVAGAVAGAAISVTGAVVSTGIRVTGAVVEAGVDAVAGSDDEDDD